MKIRFNYTFIAFMLLLACTTEEVTPRIYPRVTTVEAFDITGGGVTFKGEITFTNVEVKDHGFVWSTASGPTINLSNKISLGPASGVGAFEMRAERSLEEGKKYYLRAYAISDDFTVYGNTLEFVSLGGKAPVVKDFYPALGTWTDTVTVVGENFSDENTSNIVKFANATAVVFKATKDTLSVLVPYDLVTELSKVTVSVAGNSSQIDKQFQLKAPIIESVTPGIGLEGTNAVIQGKGLLSYSTEVFFGDTKATIVNWSSTRIDCVVPKRPNGEVLLKVKTGEGNLFATIPFKIQPEHLPELNLIQPTVSKPGEIIKLIGNYFAEPGQNTVKFGGIEAVIVSESKTEIEVRVPYTETRTPTITVTSYGSGVSLDGFTIKSPAITDFSPYRTIPGAQITITGSDLIWTHLKVLLDDQELPIENVDETHIYARLPLQLNDHEGIVKVFFYDQEFILNQTLKAPWIVLSDFPDINAGPATDQFIYNNTAYLIFGQTKQVWKFNGSQWNRLNDFPGNASEATFSFNIGNKGYVGGGTMYATEKVKELWEYDFAGDTWTKQSDIPHQYNTGFGFAIGTDGYSLDTDYYFNLKLWKYDAAADTWTIKSATPPTELSAYMRDFVIGNTAYLFDLLALPNSWKYTPTSNQFTHLGTPPAGLNYAFTMGTVGYAGGKYALYKYTPATNTWSPEIYPVIYPENNIGFTLNGKIYVVSFSTYDNDVYEYDTNY